MPASMTSSSVSGILKELYDEQKVQWLTYKDNPTLAMVKKEEKFPGKFFPNPVVYGLSQGVSATFANAFNNQTSPQVAEFLITRVSDFSLASIDGQLLAAAQTDPGAFIDGAELMIDAAFQVAVNRLASAMFRNGAGTIGQIATVTATAGIFTFVVSGATATAGATYTNNGNTFTVVNSITTGNSLVTTGTGAPLVNGVLTKTGGAGDATITYGSFTGSNFTVLLTNPDDAVQFDVGMTMVAVQFVDGSGLTPVDTAVIAGVNRNIGLLTVTSSTNLVADWPTTYFLATQGDLPSLSNNNFQVPNSSTNSLLKLAGFAAWLPLAGPPAVDSFFGVNRNLDTQRLAGVTFDGTALSLEEALLQGTGRVALNGGRVDTGICSYATYTALIISLGSKVQYIDEKIGEIGFRGVQVNGANTVMSVFPDRNCPDGVIYLLEMDSWILRSQNPAPHILKYMDEIEILRIPGVDSAELRVGTYGNFYTTRPGHNGAMMVQLQEF